MSMVEVSPNQTTGSRENAISEQMHARDPNVDQPTVQALVDKIIDRLSHRPTLGATYRLQFTAGGLRFPQATKITGYLRELGITHVYASPYLKSRSQSTHGYDVVDHSRVNDELGSAEDYHAFVQSVKSQGLGQLLDIIPNHMSVGTDENAWWMDVLMNGPASPYANFFDIDWQPGKRELEGRVLLPVLGDLYGKVLESGELPIRYQQGSFFLNCGASMLPLDPQTWNQILGIELEALEKTQGTEDSAVMELKSILTALTYLPARHETQPERIAERRRERLVIQQRLQRLYDESEVIRNHVGQCLEKINGVAGDPKSFDALDRLLNSQAYLLVNWKSGSDELNYRRFFDVTELAALCMENVEVFEATHGYVLQLMLDGVVDGFRIDHIDGLFDPAEYLWRLQWSFVRVVAKDICRQQRGELTPEVWQQLEPQVLHAVQERLGGHDPTALFLRSTDPLNQQLRPNDDYEDVGGERVGESVAHGKLPIFVVVEKILGHDEPLPRNWPVMGTTGYDFLNLCNGLFVDDRGLTQLEKHYRRFVELKEDFRDLVYSAKRLILSSSMQSEVQLLAHRLDRLSNRHRRSRDYTLQALRAAIREIIACFSVYRSYIREYQISKRDQRVVQQAVAQAMRRNPNIDRNVLSFVRDVLLLQQPNELDENGKLERQLFIGRFQQVTSPVMAKGVEDTTFYRYFPLASLEEVGGEPTHAITSVEEFHRQNKERSEQWPEAMLASTTHDTKRSEDVRARLNVLSEVPGQWRSVMQRWTRWNRKFIQDVEGLPAPSRNDEWLFYQSLVGIWPLQKPDEQELADIVGRLQAYLEKATREAKERTSWISPNARYDESVKQFIAKVMENPQSRFMVDMQKFHQEICASGLYNSLSQTLLKLTSPGVPDIYQGQEMWDFSLVDPDNRRPVDFGRREWLLREMVDLVQQPGGRLEFAKHLAREPADDRTKLFLTWTTLQARLTHQELFLRGNYQPLLAEGQQKDCVVAFRRQWGEDQAIIVAPRRFYHLTHGDGASIPIGMEAWHDTYIDVSGQATSNASSRFVNVFTGEEIQLEGTKLSVADLLRSFPFALLVQASQTH